MRAEPLSLTSHYSLTKNRIMPHLELISPTAEDAPELGRLCFQAFRCVSQSHGSEPDFPDVETAIRLIEFIMSLPSSYKVAARLDGQLVGSNFLLLTDQVAGVGPITVAPDFQGRGVGRRLMEAALDYARALGFRSVRLMQDSYNLASLSLYASLGFDVREPVAVMTAAAAVQTDPTVRGARLEDLPALEQLCLRFYRVSRRNELAAWIQSGFPVFLRDVKGRRTGYLAAGKLGHGVAETQADALALIGEIGRRIAPPLAAFYCPLRNTALYRALMSQGCRVTKVMNLMTLGPYEEPTPVWLPSVAY